MNKETESISEVIRKFFPDFQDSFPFSKFGKGNINTSYIFQYQKERCILQKINPLVFPNTTHLIENIQTVYHHLQIIAPELALIELIPTTDGEMTCKGSDGFYYRVFPFIPDSESFEFPPSPQHAFEGAQAIGQFLKCLETLDARKLHYTIPDFHNSLHRLKQFEKAIEEDAVNRLKSVEKEVQFIKSHQSVFYHIAEADLPIRAVHNDTKMDNVLFNAKTGKVIGLIDWDTIMPGTILSDYGDMIRTMINPIPEDSVKLDDLKIDERLLSNLKEGFLIFTEKMLTKTEKKLLSIAPLWITLEQALRFLTDYLQGDVYYRIEYDHHNLDRTRNQIRLFECLQRTKA